MESEHGPGLQDYLCENYEGTANTLYTIHWPAMGSYINTFGDEGHECH